MKAGRNRKPKRQPRRPSASSRWKRGRSTLATLALLLGVFQQVGSFGREAAPTVVRVIATARNAVNGPPVTRAELESLRLKPAW